MKSRKIQRFKTQNKALDDEKNKIRQLQLAFTKTLKENGISFEEIHKQTGLPINEINEI